MPVERSPPRDRSDPLVFAPKLKTHSSLSNLHTLGTQKSVKSVPTIVTSDSAITSLTISPSAALSWSDQCTTPKTNTTTPTSFTRTTTNTPVTTLASNTITTITTSVISSGAPIMSTSTSTLQSQANTENLTPKRTRNSPVTACEGGRTIKKQKSQTQTQTKQTSLKSYWLSDSNRFAPLADMGHSDCDSGTTSALTPKNPTPKPPPIYIQNVENINNLTKALNSIKQVKYEMKVLSNNEVKIQAIDSVNYTSIIKLLKEKSTQYYTFKPKEQRGFKVILRNMHHSTDLKEITRELNEQGHEVIYIQNIMQSGTKKPLPMFSIELKPDSNNKNIYSLTSLLHCKVNFEPPHQKRIIPQCKNCQKYGHTKNFCSKIPICVKCAGEHKTSECKLNMDSSKIKCALCGENHTANYKGCMVYKSLKIKRFPALRPKSTTLNAEELPKQSPTEKSQNLHLQTVTSNKTFAQVVASKTDSPPANTEFNEIKEMMKQLISQMSNMMTIITLLVSKIDGQNK